MAISRRRFLGRSAQAALAMAASGVSPGLAKEDKLLPIVDTHQHLWDLTKFPLSWVKSSVKLNRSFLSKDYLEATRGLNVVKAVYMEVAVDPSRQLDEARWVVDLCRRKDNPTVAGVIAGQPGSDGFRAYISEFAKTPFIKGIRARSKTSNASGGQEIDKAFLRDVRLLGELGMSFDICVPPKLLAQAARVVDLCGDTRFIVDHCGNADPKSSSRALEPWRRDMATLAKCERVVCKISGIVSRVPEVWTPDTLAPIVNHCLEVFGPDRVMFAGDWPVCLRGASYRQWVEALKQIVADRPELQQRKLFHDNAVKFYGLA